MIEPHPEGYTLVPRDALPAIPGGLRICQGTLMDTNGCWRARIRDTRLTRGYRMGRGWVWIDEVEARAVDRYRGRIWKSLEGTRPPITQKIASTCGNPNCINPDHLHLILKPKREYAPRVGGRYGWVGEGEEEYWGWIADPEPSPPRPPRRAAAPTPRNHTAGRVRGEAHSKSKLTEPDVLAIRAATDTTQAALAAQYGITSAAVRKILSRRSWSHII